MRLPTEADGEMVDNLCVIFDLDGTLVDSETPCNQAFADLLPDLADPVERLVQRYRGMELAAILADLERRLGRRLPDAFESDYRARVSELFARSLKPMPGVIEMLERLDCPKCVASSGPPAKIAQALEVSGLAAHFGGRCFSSYDIGSWKPDPGLFLHAARELGYPPNRCAVVEDSLPGIQAANAAGMHAFHFVPQGSTGFSETATVFHDMPRLVDLLATIPR